MAAERPIALLAVVEAEAVTGPVRNLLLFQQAASDAARHGARDVRLTLAVCQRGRAASSTPLAVAAKALGISVLPVAERFRFDISAIASLRRLIETVKPDLVQTHGVKSHFLARLATPALRMPWIAFHHGYTWPDAKMALYNRCDRLSLRYANYVVTTAASFIGQLTNVGVASDRIAVVRNAFALAPDLDRRRVAARHRLRASLALTPEESAVVCIGRLSKEKGHADLVDALAITRRRWPELRARLVVAGDGPERNRLTTRAARAGIADAISWLGFLPQAEHLYAAADLAVLPSHSEGSPNALLEAAAYRLPIVATSVGGIPEMLQHGQSALLVPPRRPDVLASALHRALTDSQLAADMGQQAREIVETRHDPATRARTLLSIYADVVLGSPASRASDGASSCAC